MNVQTNDLTFFEFTEDVFVDVDLKPVLNLLKTKLSQEVKQ